MFNQEEAVAIIRDCASNMIAWEDKDNMPPDSTLRREAAQWLVFAAALADIDWATAREWAAGIPFLERIQDDPHL